MEERDPLETKLPGDKPIEPDVSPPGGPVNLSGGGAPRHEPFPRYLLVPLSIVMAGAMIGAGAFFGQRGNGQEVAAGSVYQPPESAAQRTGTTDSSSNDPSRPSFSQFLDLYAAGIGLDAQQFNSCLAKGDHKDEVVSDVRLAQQLGLKGTPTFFINGKRLEGAQEFLVFQEVIDREINGSGSTKASDYSTNLQQLADAGVFDPKPVNVDLGSGPRKDSGPVTIVEFTDYQCPYCARFVVTTLPQLVKAYEGKVTFAIRDLPITSIHDKALAAAQATRCAGDQNKYWEMHDSLFANQPQWSSAR